MGRDIMCQRHWNFIIINEVIVFVCESKIVYLEHVRHV